MKLFLVRHAETGERYRERYVGSTDVPISEAGFVQAARLAKRLSEHKIEFCVCSPLLRCRQTAEILQPEIDCDIIIEDGLVEVDFGRWEGATFAEINHMDPELVEHWAADVLDFSFPDGEHNQHFVDRVSRQLDVLLSSGYESIVIVSHGGVIRAMICILLGLRFDNYLSFNVKPATYVELDVFGKSAVLSGFNC